MLDQTVTSASMVSLGLAVEHARCVPINETHQRDSRDREDREIDGDDAKSLGAKILCVRTDHVTRAADGMQQRHLEALVDLGAQARDMHVDDIGLGIEMIFPDIFQQHRAGDNLSGVAH